MRALFANNKVHFAEKLWPVILLFTLYTFINQTSKWIQQKWLTPCPVKFAVQCLSVCTLEIWPPQHEGVCIGSIRRTIVWWLQGTASTCSPWIAICERASSSCTHTDIIKFTLDITPVKLRYNVFLRRKNQYVIGEVHYNQQGRKKCRSCASHCRMFWFCYSF